MSQLPIYYKRNFAGLDPLFIKKTGNKIIQVNLDNHDNEYQILSTDIGTFNLEHFLVCPASEFNQAFATAMLKCEAMQLFPTLGLNMSARVKAHFNQPIQQTTDLKMSMAQQHNQSY